jgi:cytochrome P450
MLGLLAQSKEPDGSPLSTRRIAEHLLLLYWAGYDTTASTGSWALWELACAPRWQEKLHEEQSRVFGEGPVTMEGPLPVQGMVLREIERLRPAGIFFPRELTEDVEFGGKTIEKGSLIMYSPYVTHRIPSLFPDPESFLPERWDPAGGPGAETKPAPVTALVGFGGGPRICLGKAFAQLQLKVMLTAILRRFQLAPAPDAKMVPVPLPMYRPSGARVELRSRATAKRAA